jgi:hypothetical protein
MVDLSQDGAKEQQREETTKAVTHIVKCASHMNEEGKYFHDSLGRKGECNKGPALEPNGIEGVLEFIKKYKGEMRCSFFLRGTNLFSF